MLHQRPEANEIKASGHLICRVFFQLQLSRGIWPGSFVLRMTLMTLTGRIRMRITVYLGSNNGNDPSVAEEAKALGSWIGSSGHTLVYGGSESGLMGILAKSTLESGGKVIGVEPQFFIDAGFQYDEITELIVTEDMPQRKTKMIELGDAFIAFPGGTGTLEEIAEVMSKVSMGQLTAPCILYNLNGYYDGLKTLLRIMIDKGFSSEDRLKGICFADDFEAVKRALSAAC